MSLPQPPPSDDANPFGAPEEGLGKRPSVNPFGELEPATVPAGQDPQLRPRTATTGESTNPFATVNLSARADSNPFATVNLGGMDMTTAAAALATSANPFGDLDAADGERGHGAQADVPLATPAVLNPFDGDVND